MRNVRSYDIYTVMTPQPNLGEDSEALTIRMPRSLVVALDEFRRAQPDIPNRSEAIRRLLAERLLPKADE